MGLKKLSLVQGIGMFDDLTVRENLEYACRLHAPKSTSASQASPSSADLHEVHALKSLRAIYR